MADITYTVTEVSPEEIPGFEQYSEDDKGLINSFEINNLFDPSKNHIELSILDFSNNLLEYDENYKNYYQLENAQSAGRSGASILTVDPVKDIQVYGYELGGVVLLYHLLNDLYTVNNSSTEFFIESISEDRTELRLLAVSLTDNEVINLTAQIKSNLETESYYSDFRLNFKNNDLFIGINIDTVDVNQGKAVVVKLYEPLPGDYSEKSKLSIVEIVSDSVSYNIDYNIITTPPIQPTLRSPNFNLEISDENTVPTGYLNYNELFSYPVENANSEIYSLFNEKGIDVSIDFTDYSDFIHFSSAEERLNNLKYKIDLISDYSASLASIQTGALGSRAYFENLITGIISNFDHYERFVYYESGSSSWPKSNSTRPYENIRSVDPITFIPNPTVSAWYSTQLTQAIAFDRTNGNSLVNAVPSYLKDDNSNVNYLTFIYMIGQHFDNLWTYARAVTDKYDGDNRMNHGISKDLVGEALKNFGVKLYTSNKSIEDLFGSLIGQSYQSGSEYITDYIVAIPTGSNTPIEPAGLDNYQKEIQKRIYHNLPLLLKSKGTERGLRALINCFGIPSDILQIKYFGGRNTTERPFFGDYSYYTSSLDKVRLDNTGSIIPGNTLSGNTSNIKRDSKYTDDLHNIEVGFAPSDNVDRYIISHSASTFNIDDYIGDPRSLTSPNYTGLYQIAEGILGDLERYDLQDYVRLIKFFDNVIFKMVKDFIPARVVADTGIIIKPNLLNRSKAKSVSLEVTRPEHTGSVDTAFIESRDGGVYYSGSTETITAYNRQVRTPQGLDWKYDHKHEEARYDGELNNSEVVITNGELGKNNPYLNPIYPPTYYDVNIYHTPPTGVCTIQPRSPGYATPNSVVDLADYFINTNSTTVFKVGPSPTTTVVVNTPTSYSFTGIAATVFYISATDPNSTNTCIKENTVTLQECTLELVANTSELVTPGQVLNLSSYITNPSNLLPTEIKYYIDEVLKPSGTYTVPTTAIQIGLSIITLTVKSNQGRCILTKIFNVNTVVTSIVVLNTYVSTADLQVIVSNNSSNSSIYEKGIVWSTSPNPTVGALGVTKLTSNALITAPFSMYPHPLSGSTQYYLRSYAITSLGTTYSSDATITTLPQGETVLTRTSTDATNINFLVNATNPAQLPITPSPATTGTPLQIKLELTTIATPGTTETGIEVTGTNTFAGVKQLPLYNRQANAPYVFRAKATYIQGNTPHNLVVYSTPVNYTTPSLAIGQSLAGGTILSYKQYGSTGYAGTTQALILYPNSITTMRPGVTNPVTYTQATGGLTLNTFLFSDWRLMTRAEAQVLFILKASLGTAGSSLGTSNYYWTSTSDPFSFNSKFVARFSNTGTYTNNENSYNISSGNTAYFRPVRDYATSLP